VKPPPYEHEPETKRPRLRPPWPFLFLFLFCAGCSAQPQPANTSPRLALDPQRFDAGRAYREVAGLVELGPRHATTEGAQRAAHYLRDRLSGVGVDASIVTFHDITPIGQQPFHNVVGRLPGVDDNRIFILGSHFDTKSGIGAGFVGANDSGSSSGALLELARVLAEAYAGQPETRRPEILFLFFDGEEAMHQYGPDDGFHGSRFHARQLERTGRAERVRAVLVLDMIGDRDLTVTLPQNNTPHLNAAILEAAHAEGVREKFSLYPGAIGDDHTSYLKYGMPAAVIIDFYYGSGPGKNDYWHTLADTMDKISEESLGAIGRVTLRTLNALL